jgi:hypothetical protein
MHLTYNEVTLVTLPVHCMLCCQGAIVVYFCGCSALCCSQLLLQLLVVACYVLCSRVSKSRVLSPVGACSVLCCCQLLLQLLVQFRVMLSQLLLQLPAAVKESAVKQQLTATSCVSETHSKSVTATEEQHKSKGTTLRSCQVLS